MQIRRPVVAGSFYPEDVVMLKKEISGYLSAAKDKVKQELSWNLMPACRLYVFWSCCSVFLCICDR